MTQPQPTDNDQLFSRLTEDQKAELLAQIATGGGAAEDGEGDGLQTVTAQNILDTLGAVGGAELAAREFPPLQFLLDGVIALGHLGMMGGRAKSGKSWWLLQFAMAVDMGREFLGKATRQARVLYIALEDGERRIKQRMSSLGWQPQTAVFLFNLAQFDERGGIGPGLAQADVLAGEFDLIIIDTLIKTLSGQADENNNTEMGAIVNKLAAIAHERDTAILISHHTGKGGADDIFDTLRGASALRGAYDVGMIIDRKRGEREAILHFESRDIDLSSLTIRQAEDGAGWDCLGAGYEIHKIRAGRQIVATIQEQGEGLTVKGLAEGSGKSEQTIRKQLKTAEKNGLVAQATGKSSGTKPAAQWWLTAVAGGSGIPDNFDQAEDEDGDQGDQGDGEQTDSSQPDGESKQLLLENI